MKALKRLAVLFLALADLADRAAVAPRALCTLVLWILRPAEAAGRGLLADYGWQFVEADTIAPRMVPDEGPTAACRLACELRMLAEALCLFAAQLSVLELDETECRSGPRAVFPETARRAGDCISVRYSARLWPDTS